MSEDPASAASTTEAQLRQRIVELERRLSTYERAVAPGQIGAQAILDSIPVPIFVKDAEGVYQSCNDAFARYLGFARAEIIGHTAYDIAPAHLAERYHMADLDLIRQGTSQVYEANVVPADGPARDVRFHKAVFHASDGSVAGLVGIILDVTYEKRLARELRAGEELIRQFLDALPIGVFVVDAQQRPFFTNRAAREAIGATADAESVGLRLSERLRIAGSDALYPPEGLPLAAALHGESATVDDIELLTDQRRVPLRAQAVPVRDAGGSIGYALLAFSDISAERRAEAALRIRDEQARMIQAQSEVLEELSTPLLAIREGVVVMPLVGSIDPRRSQQINAALLQGVSELRARVAIVDITGVPMVDSQVASALVHAAQAVKLLGAQVVLTGIRPEVAQILVGLDVGLKEIVTFGTLQAGIAYALGSR